MQRLRYARSSSLVAVLLASQLVPAHAAAQTPPAASEPAPAPPPPPKPAASKPAESTETTAPVETAQPGETGKSSDATEPPATAGTEAAAEPAAPAAEATSPAPSVPPAVPARQPLEVAADASTSYPLQVLSPIPGLQLRVYPIELDDVTRGPTRDFDKFSDTCAAPCRTSLAPGAYQLTVKTPDGERATTNTGLLLEGPATVDVDVISHASTRRAGWYWALVGSSAGALATSVGLLQDCGPDHDCAKSASFGIWTGITVMAVSWLIGIPKIATKDEATVTIRPGISGGPAASRSGARTQTGASAPKLAGAF